MRRCCAQGMRNGLIVVGLFLLVLSVFLRRLQHHILLAKPTRSDVQRIVEQQMRRMPCDADVSALSAATVLMAMQPSCADAEALGHRALSGAIREEISASENGVPFLAGRRKVGQRHFVAALSELTGMSADHIARLGTVQTEFSWTGQVCV